MVTWGGALKKTRNAFSNVLSRVLSPRLSAPDEGDIEELEEALLRADVAPRLVMDILRDIDKAYRGLTTPRREIVSRLLRNRLADPQPDPLLSGQYPCTVLLVVGVNGSGKTTTCAKLAHRLKEQGHRPLLGAADTFRAAGSDQLKLWAGRLGCECVGGATGADAAAVAYDALQAAQARSCDVLIIDTAGRMHTREPLMKELQKVRSSLNKCLPGAPHETWMVLDASLGRNAILQAKAFHEITPLSGIIVSKLDGSSKAGFLFSVQNELGVPIRYAGLGEGAEDLVPFDPDAFVKAALAVEGDED